MYRVYVGNIDSEVTDDALVDVLTQRGIAATGLVLKRGYAFIDCPDSATFNMTIENLNGIQYDKISLIALLEANQIER